MILGAACCSLFVAASALTACSSDNPPPAGSSGTVATDGGDGGETGPGLPNPNDELCVGLDGGKTVAEIGQNVDPPPPLGGAIKGGTYLLDELYAYGPIDAGPEAGPEPPNEALTGRSGMAAGS